MRVWWKREREKRGRRREKIHVDRDKYRKELIKANMQTKSKKEEITSDKWPTNKLIVFNNVKAFFDESFPMIAIPWYFLPFHFLFSPTKRGCMPLSSYKFFQILSRWLVFCLATWFIWYWLKRKSSIWEFSEFKAGNHIFVY